MDSDVKISHDWSKMVRQVDTWSQRWRHHLHIFNKCDDYLKQLPFKNMLICISFKTSKNIKYMPLCINFLQCCCMPELRKYRCLFLIVVILWYESKMLLPELRKTFYEFPALVVLYCHTSNENLCFWLVKMK